MKYLFSFHYRYEKTLWSVGYFFHCLINIFAILTALTMKNIIKWQPWVIFVGQEYPQPWCIYNLTFLLTHGVCVKLSKILVQVSKLLTTRSFFYQYQYPGFRTHLAKGISYFIHQSFVQLINNFWYWEILKVVSQLLKHIQGLVDLKYNLKLSIEPTGEC